MGAAVVDLKRKKPEENEEESLKQTGDGTSLSKFTQVQANVTSLHLFNNFILVITYIPVTS